MRKLGFLLTLFVLVCTMSRAQNKAVVKRYAMYGVAFYNLENLFDTLHDAGKNDYEFLPNGTNKWGKMKYEAKLKNMSKVLSQLCTDKLPIGPAVVGVSEVENHHVLNDLLKQDALRNKGWKYVNVAGVDRRGVECAFFYNPKLFTLESYRMVPYYYLDPAQPEVDLGFWVDDKNVVRPFEDLKGDTTYITRGFLVMTGQLAGERIHFIVCHWPSRAATSPARERAGYQIRKLKDALLDEDPQSSVIIMGDLNDDPKDASVTKSLGAISKQKDVKNSHDLYNPFYDTLYKVGQGSLLYDGKWNLFDQIIFTGNLIGNDRSTLKYHKNELFLRDYLFQQEGKYKGAPLRTHASGVWLNGYSDHLPSIIYLVKEVK